VEPSRLSRRHEFFGGNRAASRRLCSVPGRVL
jgi:hypothetical protein